jgi:hypothetical protein
VHVVHVCARQIDAVVVFIESNSCACVRVRCKGVESGKNTVLIMEFIR